MRLRGGTLLLCQDYCIDSVPRKRINNFYQLNLEIMTPHISMWRISFFYWKCGGGGAYNRHSALPLSSGDRAWKLRRSAIQHRRPMEFFSQNSFDSLAPVLAADAPLEALGLSVRTSNALKGVGCATIDDVLRLDIHAPIRGLGRKAKEELLAKLNDAGLVHPLAGNPSEIRMLERSLARIEERVDAALGLVAKEIRSARQRLRKLKTRG